ncbi:hypothetical protein HYALB_00009414 [Hymenoscyphus albidus]|uniref:DUF7923 domain-containing protein n=1 Tax=Hymenoscyphus albidus TaxID=595503 RepID=A0A9N9LP13_9HELO|nr:hypothetical protein HYALB_00009414 [Hymenoscyphus albidus]
MASYDDLMADYRSRFAELERKEQNVLYEQRYLIKASYILLPLPSPPPLTPLNPIFPPAYPLTSMKKLLDDNVRLIQDCNNLAAADDKQKRIESLEASLKSEENLRMEQENEILKLREFKAFVFNNEYLKDGVIGGAKAAQAFMAKVREYLVSTPGLVANPNSVQVKVKAYANLEALEKVCLAKRKIGTVGDLRRFWIGFTRAFAMCDVVDVGHGKEEADSKIRDVLNFNIDTVQCAHVLMACCHDTGYITELRKYSVPAMVHRITLLQIGEIRFEMKNLGFSTTQIFEPLFSFISKPVIHNDSSDTPQEKEESLEMTFHQLLNLSIGRKVSARNGNNRRHVHQQSAATNSPASKQINDFRKMITKADLCLAHYAGFECHPSPCSYNHTYRKERSELSSPERTVIFDLYRGFWSHSENLLKPNVQPNRRWDKSSGDWGYDSMLGQ